MSVSGSVTERGRMWWRGCRGRMAWNKVTKWTFLMGSKNGGRLVEMESSRAKSQSSHRSTPSSQAPDSVEKRKRGETPEQGQEVTSRRAAPLRAAASRLTLRSFLIAKSNANLAILSAFALVETLRLSTTPG